MRQRESVVVPSRCRTTNEQARPKLKARKLILTAGSSADTGCAAISRGSSSSKEEDGSTRVLGRLTVLPAPKAHVPSEGARRPLGQRDRLVATARVPTPEECMALEHVPFEDAPFSPSAFGSRAFGASAVQSAFRGGAFGVETLSARPYGRKQGCGDTCAFGGSVFGRGSNRAAFGGTRVGGFGCSH